ncbi:MAG: ABC transporter permease [Bacteroidales bacterium]|nr:ABC transporter permease [Bacteroidales bacterium]
MLKKYLNIAIRNILRNKLYGAINIIGLSISIACSILIILFVKYEFSFDRFHTRANRIYRFTMEVENENGYKAHFARCATSWIKYVPEEFPEVEKMVMLFPGRRMTLMANEKKFVLENAYYTDSAFFSVFSISPLKGDRNKVLQEPYTAVISESLARKYFGETDPVGQTITNTGWHDGEKWTKLNYTITGVFKDIPVTSHFHTDLLISDKSQNSESWKYVYLLLHKHAQPSDFLKKFDAFLDRHTDDKSNSNIIVPHLQRITDIHLKSNKDREMEDNSNMTVILILSITGLIILTVSWINYLNLNIAGIYGRLRNLHMYKIHGCTNTGLMVMYFIESLIITTIAFSLAYLLIRISLPVLSSVTGNMLHPNLMSFFPETLHWMAILFAGTIIIGSVPVLLFFMRFYPSTKSVVTQSVAAKRKPPAGFRKSLVVFQFILTIVLIISALVINIQGRYIQERQSGAKLDSVLVIKLFNQDIMSHYSVLKSELLRSPSIKEVTASFEDPFDLTMDAMGFETSGINPENKDKILWVYVADDNFFKFLDVPIIAGHDFPPLKEYRIREDDSQGEAVVNGHHLSSYINRREDYVLNETAVKGLGWTPEEAVGKPFKLKFLWGENVIFGGQIVGVVKDFNVNTLHHEIKPYVFFQKNIWFWNLLVKTDEKNGQKALQHISETWERIVKDYPLDYKYNKNIFFEAYKKEIIQSRLTNFFSLLAIIVSCMGLFAISSVIILQRTKEIGIRKVNGASSLSIMYMLIKEFAFLVVLSFIIACPVGYYAMSTWLESFAYRISLGWWIFAVAGLVAIFVACLTVCWQSWRAASRNPVETLRYE